MFLRREAGMKWAVDRRSLIRAASRVALAGWVATASGCGLILFPQVQEVPVECLTEPTASFAVPTEGTSARSGAVLRLDRRKDYTVHVRAEGYLPAQVRIESEFSVGRIVTSVVLNGGHGIFTLFISTVLGCFADFRAGAWQVLEPTDLSVELAPDPSAPAPARQGQASASWPTTAPSPSGFCRSCGASAGSTTFCTSCGARQ